MTEMTGKLVFKKSLYHVYTKRYTKITHVRLLLFFHTLKEQGTTPNIIRVLFSIYEFDFGSDDQLFPNLSFGDLERETAEDSTTIISRSSLNDHSSRK